MWTLECDGDLFQGRKLWLKPGRQYLFGRTKAATGPNEQFHVIQNKSVSRKHLVISVAAVAREQERTVHSRSEVSITDDSKLGSHLDGDVFTKTTRTLTKTEHTIQLGNWGQAFRIKWSPAVLTFNFSDRDFKKAPDILDRWRDKLEPSDIKVTNNYFTNATTHVITPKRNVPKGLQALVNGRFIVEEAFASALEYATSPKHPFEDGATPSQSPLEEDFVANWPDELKFLPGPGKEPHPQPPEKYAPSAERASVFEGFTFVLSDQAQYDLLSPALVDGRANCVKFNMKPGESRSDELVRLVRECAENKGLQDVYDEDAEKAVVVVRFIEKGELEGWANDFLTEVDLELEQRSVGQNEFLDAIVQNDARPLKQPIQFESQSSRLPASTAPELRNGTRERTQPEVPGDESHTGHKRHSDEEPQPDSEIRRVKNDPNPTPTRKPAPKVRIGRLVTKSRFTTIDDSDEEDLPPPSGQGSTPTTSQEARIQNAHKLSTQRFANSKPDSQSLFVSESQSQTHAQQNNASLDKAMNTTHKRPLPPSGDEEGDNANMFDKLLPGATAMKKRRLEKGYVVATPTSRDRSLDAEPKTSKQAPARKAMKEIDVRETARSHARQLDAASMTHRSRQEVTSEMLEDDDAEQVEELDPADLQNLVIVEEMEVPVRHRSLHGHVNGESTEGVNETSDRWDPRWNGLKNFKKFRRKGSEAVDAGNRPRRVLVGLEEVKRQDFGLGESYWLESSSSRKTSRNKGHSRSQSQSQSHIDSVRTRGEEEDDAQLDIEPEEVAGRPREGPIADALASQKRRPRGGESTTMETASASASASGATKRPASAAGRAQQKEPPAKRQRQGRSAAPTQADESSSEEDELKFRFKRRR